MEVEAAGLWQFTAAAPSSFVPAVRCGEARVQRTGVDVALAECVRVDGMGRGALRDEGLGGGFAVVEVVVVVTKNGRMLGEVGVGLAGRLAAVSVTFFTSSSGAVAGAFFFPATRTLSSLAT